MARITQSAYPVLARLIGWFGITSDGFLDKRYDCLREAGYLGLYTQLVPLHFLVDLVFPRSY